MTKAKRSPVSWKEELVEAVKVLRDTLEFVEYKAPGYDWNADPIGLTEKIGDAYAKANTALSRATPKEAA